MAHTVDYAPQVGDIVTVRGHHCVITRILPFGTIEVESLDSDHAWRLSGLSYTAKTA